MIMILFIIVLLILTFLVNTAILILAFKACRILNKEIKKEDLEIDDNFPPFYLEISQLLMDAGFSTMIIHEENGDPSVVIDNEGEMVPICRLPKTEYKKGSKGYEAQLRIIKKDIIDLLKEKNLYAEDK